MSADEVSLRSGVLYPIGELSKAELQRIAQLSYGQTKYAVEKLQEAGKIYKLGENRSPNTKYALLSD